MIQALSSNLKPLSFRAYTKVDQIFDHILKDYKTRSLNGHKISLEENDSVNDITHTRT